MSDPILTKTRRAVAAGLSRRDLFRNGSLLAAGGILPAASQLAAAPAPALTIGPNLYESIGVKPVINCKGTFTIISGSLSLPEVKKAMFEASQHFVHMDELMDGIGKRLAEITGAEYGMISSGCAAALAHATAACIAGGNPELMQRLPDLRGMKNEVIAPDYSRNVYDHAVRMLGVKMVNVENEAELRSAINPQTAMIMVLATTEDSGPFGLPQIAKIAKERGVPVLVDAAAEDLTIPNAHLSRGADLVAYSGGKALRGPQSAGLLLGRKDLVKAAWVNSAPHHAFGRPMKVDKEAAMGMLAAVEMWVKRDHKAEWKAWESWIDEIATSVKRVSGVSTKVSQPSGLSNRSPRLDITWETSKVDITGEEVEKYFWSNDTRIILAGGRGNRRSGGENTVTIMPWQMSPGDSKVVAAELYRVLSKPPKIDYAPKSTAPMSNVGGQWDLHLDYVLGSADHRLALEQDGADLNGSHFGELSEGDLSGWVEGTDVHFRSSQGWEGSRFGFEFHGKVSGDQMSGDVDMGEYGPAKFSAVRHNYRGRRPPARPVKNI